MTVVLDLQPRRAEGFGLIVAAAPNVIDPDRVDDVFELPRAAIDEQEIEFAPNLGVDFVGNAYAARLGDRFQPGADIDTLSVEVLAIDDDVAEIQPDAEFHFLSITEMRVALAEQFLELGGAQHGLDRDVDRYSAALP